MAPLHVAYNYRGRVGVFAAAFVSLQPIQFLGLYAETEDRPAGDDESSGPSGHRAADLSVFGFSEVSELLPL